MTHQIKIDRAANQADYLPMATREILDSISPLLVKQLTGAQLAEVMRCLDKHWHKAIAHAEAGILSEGGLWDNRRQGFRELQPAAANA